MNSCESYNISFPIHNKTTYFKTKDFFFSLITKNTFLEYIYEFSLKRLEYRQKVLYTKILIFHKDVIYYAKFMKNSVLPYRQKIIII